MSLDHVIFLAPPAGGPGLSALFWSFAEFLSRHHSSLRCEVPSFIRRLAPGGCDHPEGHDLVWCEPHGPIPAAGCVLAVVRPIKVDVIGFWDWWARARVQNPVPRVSVLMWDPDGDGSTDFEFKHGPVRALSLPTRILIGAENSGRRLQDESPRWNVRLHAVFRELMSSWDEERKGPEHDWDPIAFEVELDARFWASLQARPLEAPGPEAVRSRLDEVIQGLVLSQTSLAGRGKEIQSVRNTFLSNVIGWGPVEELFNDPLVTDILINGPDQIYVERNGQMMRTNRAFRDEKQLKTIVDRMVGGVGRRVDTASPCCDVRLPSGDRVNVVLPPLSLSGPIVTVRRFRSDVKSLSDLVNLKMLTDAQAEDLIALVRSHANVVISGNTGSGKTTLLNALSAHIDASERIVTLEDAAELKLQQPHVVRLETRLKNVEGAGAVTMADLVINALRMRPDRIIVGECRGGEAVPMIQAMNTGHDGSMTTLHANSAEDALRRLESMVMLGAPEWPIGMVRQQIASGVDRIIHLRRRGTVRELVEIKTLNRGGAKRDLQTDSPAFA